MSTLPTILSNTLAGNFDIGTTQSIGGRDVERGPNNTAGFPQFFAPAGSSTPPVPTILSLLPNPAAVGVPVTYSVTGFENNITTAVVNGTNQPTISATDETTGTFTVETGTTAGTVTLSNTGETADSVTDLTLTAGPIITSVPATAEDQTTVTVDGYQFTAGMTATDAGSTAIPLTFISANQVTFTALDTYTDGPITFTNISGSYTSDTDIEFVPIVRNTTLFNALTYTESLISAQTFSTRPPANANNNNKTDGFILTNVGGGATIDYRCTFASPVFINRIELYLGQFNGGFNAPQNVTVYRGGTKSDPVIYSATMHTLSASDGTTKTHIYDTTTDTDFDTPSSVYLVSFSETSGATSSSVNEVDLLGYVI